jgi:ferredoxin-thioredoxin reductase catalytic subunit
MDKDMKILLERIKAFCKERGYSLSPDAEIILNDMKHIKETAGDCYCPCRKQQSPDTVCICKPVRNGLVDIMGSCFCNLILSRKL